MTEEYPLKTTVEVANKLKSAFALTDKEAFVLALQVEMRQFLDAILDETRRTRKLLEERQAPPSPSVGGRPKGMYGYSIPNG